jgi:hypothetical protein
MTDRLVPIYVLCLCGYPDDGRERPTFKEFKAWIDAGKPDAFNGTKSLRTKSGRIFNGRIE